MANMAKLVFILFGFPFLSLFSWYLINHILLCSCCLKVGVAISSSSMWINSSHCNRDSWKGLRWPWISTKWKRRWSTAPVCAMRTEPPRRIYKTGMSGEDAPLMGCQTYSDVGTGSQSEKCEGGFALSTKILHWLTLSSSREHSLCIARLQVSFSLWQQSSPSCLLILQE